MREPQAAFVDLAGGLSGRLRVVFAGGGFRLADGTSAGKSSTNGTWIRLSGLHEKSDRCDLESGDELLIGTIRFHVTATHTVVERPL